MPFLSHDALDFFYQEQGTGRPFFFQHGLGGDLNQPFGLFQPPPGVRLIGFDCRGHGNTRPVGPTQKLTLATFAEDLRAIMAALKIERAVIGGISMGAAVALNFTLRFPDQAAAMVLVRPAWLDRPNPRNTSVYSEIARLIREYGAERGLEIFHQSKIFADAQAAAPDAAQSLCRQFMSPRAEDAVARLEMIPNDSPCASLEELKLIRVPTLILANQQDPIHPFEYGKMIHEAIPGSRFAELTSKSKDPEKHRSQMQKLVEEFLVDGAL